MNLRVVSVYLWVIALLGCAELGLEYRAHLRGWETMMFPMKTASRKSQTAASVRHGPTGQFPFRSEIVPKECPQGTSRIWIASASHAEDIYLGVEEIFPTQTVKMLGAREQGGRRWDVLNASRAGNLILTNTADLARIGNAWRPNVVVLYQMSIEIVDLSRKHLAGNHATEKKHSEGHDDAPLIASAGVIAKASAGMTTYTSLKANVTPWFAGQRILADELGEEAEREYERRIYGFLQQVRKLKGTPVLCTFATSHGFDYSGRLPGEVRQFMLRYNRYLSTQGWLETIARLNSAIRRIAADEDAILVDCERAMTGRAQYFRDFVHFTPAGHRKVAELLSEKLVVSPLRPEPLVAKEKRCLATSPPEREGFE